MRFALPLFVFACAKDPDVDGDGDGWRAPEDCDDHDALVHPDAVEQCDELDNDCDDDVDEGLGRTLWTDADGDGYGTAPSVIACRVEEGLAEQQGDCDDSNPAIHPGAKDPCDGVDDDCDGVNPTESTWYEDSDGDGYGDLGSTASSCDAPDGFVVDATDCDDDAAEVHPGVDDECENGVDEDCVGGDALCGFAEEIQLADADAILTSELGNSDAGRLLEVGDMNGDGCDDVVVAALNLNGGYVVPGPISGETTFESAGHTLTGVLTAGAGRSIGAGDVDGDGLDDVAFGAPYGPSYGQFIVYGPVTSDVDLDTDSDVALTGIHANFLGHGSDLADVNGDGIEDAIVADWAESSTAGAFYVAFGPLTANVDLQSDADRYAATESGAVMGRMIHAGVDMDGDGIGEIVANAVGSSVGGPWSGGLYVVAGPPAIATLDDAAFLAGPAPNATAGAGFALGDFDGDGVGDLVASAWEPSPGAAYLVYGPISDDMALADANVILEAELGSDLIAEGLWGANVDHDGPDELLVGASGHDALSDDVGATYLLADPPTGTSNVRDVAQCVFIGASSHDVSGVGVAAGNLDGADSLEVLIGAPGLGDGGGLAVVYAAF